MIDFKTTAKSFLIGGTLIGLSKYISINYSSVWASLFGGAPTGVVSAFFIPQNKVKDFLNGYIIQSFVLILDIILLNLAIKYTSIPINILNIVVILLWLFVSIAIIKLYLKKKRKKENKFV